MSLHGLIDSWVEKLGAVIGHPEMMAVFDWPRLEKALCNWQSFAEEALQKLSIMQTVNEKDKQKPNL